MKRVGFNFTGLKLTDCKKRLKPGMSGGNQTINAAHVSTGYHPQQTIAYHNTDGIMYQQLTSASHGGD